MHSACPQAHHGSSPRGQATGAVTQEPAQLRDEAGAASADSRATGFRRAKARLACGRLCGSGRARAQLRPAAGGRPHASRLLSVRPKRTDPRSEGGSAAPRPHLLGPPSPPGPLPGHEARAVTARRVLPVHAAPAAQPSSQAHPPRRREARCTGSTAETALSAARGAAQAPRRGPSDWGERPSQPSAHQAGAQVRVRHAPRHSRPPLTRHDRRPAGPPTAEVTSAPRRPYGYTRSKPFSLHRFSGPS